MTTEAPDQKSKGQKGQGEIHTVLVNHEGQYSLWLKRNPVPRGWQTVGMEGEKAECLEYIKTVWTDMTPLSIRRRN